MCAVLLSTPNNTILPRECNPKGSFSGLANTSLMILIGITAILALSEKTTILNTSICKSDYYRNVVEKLAHKNPSSLVLNVSFWDKLHYKLFSPIQPTDSEQMMVIDGGVLYLSNDYQNMLVERSGKTTFIDQYLWLIDQQKTFVSSEERMQLLTDYINLVYNQELKFNRLNRAEVGVYPINSANIGFYQYLTENEINTD